MTSNAITVQGINALAPIRISNGFYAINNGVFTHQAGTVNTGDQVAVKLITDSQPATSTSATLTIGGVSDTFTATTRTLDTTPDVFRFASRDGVRPVVRVRAAAGRGLRSDVNLGATDRAFLTLSTHDRHALHDPGFRRSLAE